MTLLLLVAALAAQWALVVPTLPEPVAVHFDAGGVPNGWMSRIGFIAFEVVVILVMAAVMLGATALTRVFPPKQINIPNRDYWLAPERREEFFARFTRHMLWLLCGVVGSFLAMNQFLVAANRVAGEPRSSVSSANWFLAATVAGLCVWMARLFFLFRRPALPVSR